MGKRFFNVLLIVLTSFFVGCAGHHVKRIEVNEVVDLSGRWNDTDSRLVAQEMIEDALNRSWVPEFHGRNNRSPVVIVGFIKNQSHEHINTDVFTKDLERTLLNSGKVKFVASHDERTGVREEREDQNKSGYTNPDTMKKIGKETGADYMLIGSVNSIKDEVKSRYVIMYQTNLEMIDLETNEKVWIGQKDLKKVVEKSKYSL